MLAYILSLLAAENREKERGRERKRRREGREKR